MENNNHWLPGGHERHLKHMEEFNDLYKLLDDLEAIGKLKGALQFALLGAEYGIPRCCIQHFISVNSLHSEERGPVDNGRMLCKKCRKQEM